MYTCSVCGKPTPNYPNHSECSSCFYFRKAECDCSLCKADRYSNCDQPVFKDIASRIRRLRGEVREDA